MSVSSTVAEAIQALQQSQGKTVPPPDKLPRDFLATAQILGQDPGLRRPLGVAGEAVFTAWTTQPAAVAVQHTIVRGQAQVASVGTDVRIPPALLVTDGFGRPLPGEPVTIKVLEGEGDIVVANKETGVDGVVSLTSWKLGPEPGLNRIEFRAAGKVTDFVASGAATRRCLIHDGNNQDAPKGTPLRKPPTIKVIEADTGLPVPNAEVDFKALDTADTIGGTTNAITEKTDTDGFAIAGVWTLSPTKGPHQLQADADGADPVTFFATAT